MTETVAVGVTYSCMSAGGAAVTQLCMKPEHGCDTVVRTEISERIDDVLELLLGDDGHAAYRQARDVGVGGEFAFTDGEYVSWTSYHTGDGYIVVDNILVKEGVVEATAEAYEVADGDMAEQLVSTLEAGESVGGDDRDELSAMLSIHVSTPEFYHNLCVDLSGNPVADLCDLPSEARRTEAQIRRETDAQFSDYPDEALELDVKH